MKILSLCKCRRAMKIFIVHASGCRNKCISFFRNSTRWSSTSLSNENGFKFKIKKLAEMFSPEWNL